jgi:hypothetical protein
VRKIMAVLACVALPVGLMAVAATAAGAQEDNHGVGDVFQLALVQTEQIAVANTGLNEALNSPDQSDNGGDGSNSADNNKAEIRTGDASADNQSQVGVHQTQNATLNEGPGGPVWHSPEVTQVGVVVTQQEAIANSGANVAANTPDQSDNSGGTNNANGNKAKISTGDASASNSSSTSVTQSQNATVNGS